MDYYGGLSHSQYGSTAGIPRYTRVPARPGIGGTSIVVPPSPALEMLSDIGTPSPAAAPLARHQSQLGDAEERQQRREMVLQESRDLLTQLGDNGVLPGNNKYESLLYYVLYIIIIYYV